ncbi:RNA polymerase sigma factor [Oscillochloris sp. ZM17-4]|uniref:RNA polymerase sigma factor n=1 Tax=Oscillochloris sp. ZM17-4 TaxID=2866714 RepID=UPI001C73751A|nr:RNA polymerase sigma factor [Oscillochloris sp. ZM17-4]
MSTSKDDLSEVIKRAQQGDQRAFDVIYDRFADPLFRYIYARCGDATAAEDMLGDLWVRVVERIEGFRLPPSGGEQAFAAWLYRIAYNLVIDTFRRKESGNVPLNPYISDRDPSPDDHAIIGDERRELREAIEKLTPDQREVVLMRFIEERSNAEVAALTGRSEGAVKVMQHRALGALAKLLGGSRGRRPENYHQEE